MIAPRHFLCRMVRGGPLVPARLRYIDHEPGVPENKREDSRWPVLILCADVGGTEIEPEWLEERLWAPVGHWKYCQPITEAEYRYQLARLRWAERHATADPTLKPRRRVDPSSVPLPSFERENA